MPGTVLRWGQSAYETDADLALERDAATALGLTWTRAPESDTPPDLTGIDVLVVTSRVRVDAAALEGFGGALVLTTTSGWDHVDVATARARGVVVARCPEARRDAVAEHTIGALITLLRRQPALDVAARGGRWARGDLPRLAPVGLAEAVVHVVGVGVIGRRVAKILAAFGATVLGTDPAGVPPGVLSVSFEEGLEACDAVTLHCGLGPGTTNLLSAARLGLLRPTAVVVNTSRGRILDVDAAVTAVRDGRLRGLSVDVFPEEPWPGLAAAAAVEGVLTSPHASGYTEGLGRRVAAEVAIALAAWTAGAPVPNVV